MRLRSSIVACLLNACSSSGGVEPAAVPVESSAPEPPTESVSAVPTTTASAVPAPSVAPAPESTEPKVVERYALVVSFISPGNGTDREAYDKLLALVKKQTKHLAVVTGRWGKEGEHDECFQLTELSAEEKKAFVAAVRKEVGGSKRVNIGENAECSSR